TKLEKSTKSCCRCGQATTACDTGWMNAAGERPLVLIVEDEPEIAELLRDFLQADGFGVARAADGAQASAALDRSPDCVLLDIMLPDRSGFDVCREIRGRSDVPVLFLTARDADEDK